MPKEPELTDIDVYARDYPQRMKILDMAVRKSLTKGQHAQLLFPTYNKRGWVEFLGIMDGGLVGKMVEDLGEGLIIGDQVFFQHRHIWDMRDV